MFGVSRAAFGGLRNTSRVWCHAPRSFFSYHGDKLDVLPTSVNTSSDAFKVRQFKILEMKR